jgi:ATP-dependent DNA helicase PIF1
MSVEIIKTYIESNKNVFLSGPGGCGKSYCLRILAKSLNDFGICCYCTAMTGIAALNLSCPGVRTRTLHSWAGIGLGKDDGDTLIAKVLGNPMSKKRWLLTKVLIIDEISMLGASLITKLDLIGRGVRKCNLPFGGLIIIVSGDFLQLPPVKDNWAFLTDAWKSLDFITVPFTTPYRYSDMIWFQLLLRMRDGKLTQDDISLLETRVTAYDEYLELGPGDGEFAIKPTILHSLKRDVYAYNMDELRKLDGEPVIYNCKDSYVKIERRVNQETYKLLLDDAIPESISLKPGAQVMLKANIDVDRKLVNGSRGVITRCEIDAVYVMFYRRNAEIRIATHTWDIEDDRMKASRSQIPLILAWSSTVHQSQGCTLDFAVCNLGSSVFEDGQAYVAASRVRSLEGLYLSNFYPSAIKTSPEALEYMYGDNTGLL